MKKKSNPLELLLSEARQPRLHEMLLIEHLGHLIAYHVLNMPPLVFNQSSIRAHRRTLPCGKAAHL